MGSESHILSCQGFKMEVKYLPNIFKLKKHVAVTISVEEVKKSAFSEKSLSFLITKIIPKKNQFHLNVGWKTMIWNCDMGTLPVFKFFLILEHSSWKFIDDSSNNPDPDPKW